MFLASHPLTSITTHTARKNEIHASASGLNFLSNRPHCGQGGDIGLCEECGYFFVAEYTLLFKGNIKIIFEMLKTYLKYV